LLSGEKLSELTQTGSETTNNSPASAELAEHASINTN
jgi:hypothetical protein